MQYSANVKVLFSAVIYGIISMQTYPFDFAFLREGFYFSESFRVQGPALVAEQYCPVLDINLFDVQNRYWVNLPIVYILHAR